MTDPGDLYTKRLPRRLDRRLGRIVVHSPASRAFARSVDVNRDVWRTRLLRIYDPIPNPNQPRGNCTGCAKSMQLNAAGNRIKGRVLTMADADRLYSIATNRDPFPGAWPPDDTGSSGLASCKAAIEAYAAGTYRWFFGGIDEIITYSSTDPEPIPVSIGSWWPEGMFRQFRKRSSDPYPWVEATGALAGGHQYIYRGYIEPLDAVVIRCWWGTGYRDVLVDRAQLGELLADDGDAHTQEVAA